MGFWIRGVAQKSGFFQTPFFLRVFEKIEPDKGGIFKTPFFLRVFEKWDPDIFQKSEISKISCSSHSENAHIKLNGFQWVFGGWGDAPFIFFMGRMGQKSKNGPSRAVYPPGWGNRYEEKMYDFQTSIVTTAMKVSQKTLTSTHHDRT